MIRIYRVMLFVLMWQFTSNAFTYDTVKMNGGIGNVRNLKKIFRTNIREKLKQMDFDTKAKKSQLISQQIFQNEYYKSANGIGVYLNLSDEVYTCSIIKDIFRRSKKCFIPRYDDKTMDMCMLYNENEVATFSKTKVNVLQPALDDNRENALDTGELNVLIVPGRAFTLSGCRLGRGKGYYDRYLKKYRAKYPNSKLYTIGVAFAEQIVDDLPVEQHDQKMDIVIYS